MTIEELYKAYGEAHLKATKLKRTIELHGDVSTNSVVSDEYKSDITEALKEVSAKINEAEVIFNTHVLDANQKELDKR